MQFVESLITKFILEVCGATGAVWGVLEVVNVRHSENQDACRYVALSTGCLFFVRYLYHHYNFQ